MPNMKLFVELMARSTGLKRELSESEQGFRRFSSRARQELSAIRQVSTSVQGGLAALGVTIGVLQQFRISAQMDKDLSQIGQTAGVGSGKVNLLRSDLFRMGRDSGQNIESLKNGFNSLVQSGLNMKEATSTLDGVNVAMAVTGAKAETLSDGLTVAAQAFQFDLAKPGQALELLDKMTVAGRLGNAELESLSQIFSRVGVNAQAAGLDFNKTLGFIEALSKVERQPERLATLADSTLRVFTNMKYMSVAQKGTGIRFYSESGSRRDPLEVLKNIKQKYDTLKTDFQRDSFVQAAFGQSDLDTIKGLRTLLQSNNLSEVARMTGMIKDASGTLRRDFSEATRNLIDQSGRLKNTLRQGADAFVKPINESLANWIQFLLDKKENGGLELSGKQMLGGTAAIVTGTYVLSKLGNKILGDWAKKKVGGLNSSTALGVAEGKILQAAAGITPVFVTNWPDSSVPGVPKTTGSGAELITSSGAGAGAGAAAGSSFATAFGAATIAGTPAIIAGFGGALSSTIGKQLAENEATWRSTSDLTKLRSQHMVLGGGANSFQVKAIDTELKRRSNWQGVFNTRKIVPSPQKRVPVQTKNVSDNTSALPVLERSRLPVTQQIKDGYPRPLVPPTGKPLAKRIAGYDGEPIPNVSVLSASERSMLLANRQTIDGLARLPVPQTDQLKSRQFVIQQPPAAPVISPFSGPDPTQSWVRELFTKGMQPPAVIGSGATEGNNITIDVHFDELARAFTRVNSMSTKVVTHSSNRGSFFEALTTTEGM